MQSINNFDNNKINKNNKNNSINKIQKDSCVIPQTYEFQKKPVGYR